MTFASYEEFWPYYVSQHLNATCRRLHIFGTSLVYLLVIAAVFTTPWLLLACPVAGYGCAWIGHFGFEKNKPAAFRNPLWSLRADFRMHRLVLLGKMGPHLAQARTLATV